MIKIPEDMIKGSRHTTSKSGELEIVEYRQCEDVVVRFVTTGYECISHAHNIRVGTVKDLLAPSVCGVGYFGVGKFSRKNTEKIYNTWHHMLGRCYDKKTQARNPTYIGCSVAPEWYNLQAFGAWYEANYPKDGGVYHLDKDIKVEGNKVYSPETCMFVSHAENVIAALAKSYVFLSPSNERVEFYNLNAFCRERGLTPANMSKVIKGSRPHHKGWRKTS